MKLFMFYVGGNYGNSNVELHDVRFSIGEAAEDCYGDLRRQWWGDPESLHLDCWGAVEQADGYDIELSSKPSEDIKLKLFFVNLGGYDPSAFTELHKNVLVVSSGEAAAKAKAKAQINHWQKPHRDRLFEIEKTLDVSAQMQRHGHHLILRPAAQEKPFHFECDYRPITEAKRS
jgi:hypothetical protein